MSEEEPLEPLEAPGSADAEAEESAHMTESSDDSELAQLPGDSVHPLTPPGSGYKSLAQSRIALGITDQSPEENSRLQYLPHMKSVAVVIQSEKVEDQHVAAPLDMPLGVLLAGVLLRSTTKPLAYSLRLPEEELDKCVLDVLVHDQWQDLPLGTTLEAVLEMRPFPNRVQVRVHRSTDETRLARRIDRAG